MSQKKPALRLATTRRSLAALAAYNLKQLMESPQFRHLDSTRKIEAATAGEVSAKTVSNILAERHDVQLENVEKIAKAFRIEPVSLLSSALDQHLIDICKVYSDADQRGRDLLADTADTVRRRIGGAEGGRTS